MRGSLFDGRAVEVHPDSLSVGGSWEAFGSSARAYDGEAIRFFYERLLERDEPHFLDIGANTGSFCLLPAFLTASCWAFEPFPPVHKILQKNLHLNGLADRVKTFQCALSDRCGHAVLRTPQGATGLSSLAPDQDASAEQTTVPTITLDALVNREGLTRLDSVKIDVEGAEISVLLGGEKTLRSRMPDIHLEYSKLYRFGHRPSDVVALLGGWGYEHLILNLEDMYFYSPRTRIGLRRLRWRYGSTADLLRRAARRLRRGLS